MIDATPLLSLYARWRQAELDRQDPVAAQQRQLLRLVARASGTAFGRDHDFAGIRSVADFQARVPLASYQDLSGRYWQGVYPHIADRAWPGRVPYFAVTSGTSSAVTKFIPVTREMLAANRRAALDVLVHHLRNRPKSSVFGGKTVMLGGSTALVEEPGGARRGDLSGIAVREVPWWARPLVLPRPDVALMTDWDRKTDILACQSRSEDIRTISGSANWLLLFLEKAMGVAGDRGIARLYPRLELLVYGGMDFRPYRGRFERLLADSRAELREVYAASEGFIAAADRGVGEGLRLIADNGLFFEFVPAGELDSDRPARHWLATVEAGVEYAVVLSNCAGLWGYVLGDTVRFIGLSPPRLLVTGRTSYHLSAFGEHVSGEQIEDAVAATAEALDAPYREFTVGPLFPSEGRRAGRHLYLIEFLGEPPPLDRFAALLDARLQATNADYRDIRAGDFGLLPPLVEAVPNGAFVVWMRRMGKLGGQHKVPRVLTDAARLADLRQMGEGR
jgi:hypothetical protein